MDKKARVEARQERARQRAEAASARREARRQKWMEVKYVAIGTKELTKDAIKARKQKLGRFAARARAAGVAATDTWKNYK